MLLNIKKRLMILHLLPKSANISDQAICRDIAKKVELDEATIVLIELTKDENGLIKWNPAKEELLSVEFSNAETLLLKAIIDELDAKKEVTPDNLDICLDIKNL